MLQSGFRLIAIFTLRFSGHSTECGAMKSYHVKMKAFRVNGVVADLAGNSAGAF